jgi:hypothetical protein
MAIFEQAVIAVQDTERFERIQQQLLTAFSSAEVEVFLNRVRRAGFKVRNFEAVLKRGLLGKTTESDYAALPVSDQGLTREKYLALIEKVELKLRQRYAKLYAYY